MPLDNKNDVSVLLCSGTYEVFTPLQSSLRVLVVDGCRA
jgi:hypothetical protein